MKGLVASLTVALLLCSGPAGAHAHLEKSTPVEGSVLASPPTALELSFSEPIHLTALSIQKDQGAKQSVKSLPGAAERTVRVALAELSPGGYTVSWRVLSADGHIMSGVLHFTVAAKP